MTFRQLVPGYIIVSTEKGDFTVSSDDNGAVGCNCGKFRVDRWCEHLQLLRDNRIEFKVRRRPKDGYEFLTRHSKRLVEALSERYTDSGE